MFASYTFGSLESEWVAFGNVKPLSKTYTVSTNTRSILLNSSQHCPKLSVSNQYSQACLEKIVFFLLLYCCKQSMHGRNTSQNKFSEMQNKRQCLKPQYQPVSHKHLGEFSLPLLFDKSDRFENLNEVLENVFLFEKKDWVRLRVSNFRCVFIMIFLMLSKDDTHHFLLITDIKNSVDFIKNRQNKLRDKLRRNCFNVCTSLENLQNPKINCYENEVATIVLTDYKKKLHQFKSTKCTWFVPLGISVDPEVLLVPMHTYAYGPNASAQNRLEGKIRYSYAFIIVEHGKDQLLSYRIDREHNCFNFLSEIWKSSQGCLYFKRIPLIFRK